MAASSFLDLSSKRLGEADALAICERLEERECKLTHLDLSHNAIGVNGIRALAGVLPSAASLEHLDLAATQAGDVGTVALVEAVLGVSGPPPTTTRTSS